MSRNGVVWLAFCSYQKGKCCDRDTEYALVLTVNESELQESCTNSSGELESKRQVPNNPEFAYESHNYNSAVRSENHPYSNGLERMTYRFGQAKKWSS